MREKLNELNIDRGLNNSAIIEEVINKTEERILKIKNLLERIKEGYEPTNKEKKELKTFTEIHKY